MNLCCIQRVLLIEKLFCFFGVRFGSFFGAGAVCLSVCLCSRSIANGQRYKLFETMYLRRLSGLPVCSRRPSVLFLFPPPHALQKAAEMV